MLLYLLDGWLSIVLQVLEGLQGLDEMLLEGQQVILLYALHRILYVVARDVLMVRLLLPLLRLGARYLGHKFMDEVALLVLAACHLHLVFLLRSWRTHQILVTLCLLEDLGD